MQRLSRFIPFLDWIRNYKRSDLSSDMTAGLTVAVMLIPQGMAYAMIAGLPPIIGLYASLIPLFVYAMLGTSRQLAVGPVAMVSLLVASGVGGIVSSGNVSLYLALAILLSLMVGVIQLLMGVARLGFLVNFLSHPVISGFTSAAALIIGLSQLKHLLGVSIPRSHHVHKIVWDALQKLGSIQPATFGIGVAGIVILLLLKRWKPAFPGALIVVGLSTLLVWWLRLDQHGVAIVGKVPSGFPAFKMPLLDLKMMKALVPTALAISLVGFMESIAVAKSFSAKNRYEVDSNQELIALGTANIAGAFTMAYPVTGGFSRTAVNAQAGARTGLASMITAVLIGLALLFFTPLFYFIPKAILASIILVAVFGLIDLKEAVLLWNIKKVDALMLGLTFFTTLSVGIEVGIGVGVLASLGILIYRSSQPHSAELGYLPGPDTYRNLKHFPDAEQRDDIAILRIDASFYFANASFVKERILRLASKKGEGLKALILDASSVNDLDSSAAHALEEVNERLGEMGVSLYFSSVKGPVRKIIAQAGLEQVMGASRFQMTTQECISHIDQVKEAPGSE